MSSYKKPHSAVVTIGSFDGIHRGHKAVLDALNKKATEEKVPSLVMTFVEPPQNYIGQRKELIMPSLKKLQLLEAEVDIVIVANFLEIAELTPGDFFEKIILKKLKASAVVVGENFRFGAERAGDVKTLKRIAERHGVDVVVVQMVNDDGKRVSSTRIRDLMKNGENEEAMELLRRPEPREEFINRT